MNFIGMEERWIRTEEAPSARRVRRNSRYTKPGTPTTGQTVREFVRSDRSHLVREIELTLDRLEAQLFAQGV